MFMLTAASLPDLVKSKESNPSMLWWGSVLLFVAMGFIMSLISLAQAVDLKHTTVKIAGLKKLLIKICDVCCAVSADEILSCYYQLVRLFSWRRIFS